MDDLALDLSNGQGDYNFIYTKLVKNETDVIGVVTNQASSVAGEISEAG